MVTEKELKRYIMKQSFSMASASILYFTLECFDYYNVFGFRNIPLWVWLGILAVVLIRALSGREKSLAKQRRFMPYIIKKTDTVESLSNDKTLYIVLYFVFYCSDILPLIRKLPVLLLFGIKSLSLMFLMFLVLTKQKIEYLESKPEGL